MKVRKIEVDKLDHRFLSVLLSEFADPKAQIAGPIFGLICYGVPERVINWALRASGRSRRALDETTTRDVVMATARQRA